MSSPAVHPHTSLWPADLTGELDHRRLKAPAVKLRSALPTPGGDMIYAVDLRVRLPNRNAFLGSSELHSMEHFLLEGFSRLLPRHFLSVGIMGCRTGFYLGFVNEGRPEVLCTTLQRILQEMQSAAAVPYANIAQCGHWQDHDLQAAQQLAQEILAQRATWLDAA
ncbi:S-ribosylhomocysteine lyase [Comamonas sp. NLF-1-9]|uniref:S-ribosylhomocysteine lyase n=1 Tax=Comamonas sp. NLF-1-9 TaxID=2853163 RepID=UPI001C488F95|nr:S-ribosylhomocysteine lyase [Comamonas sp. NLF-1-9]QXL84974.1 S-ribosylhomocysteine lyase [Comamonas sp. NLF-1-9]